MTPKEEALEMVNKFSAYIPYYSKIDNIRKAKYCALLSVQYIINANPYSNPLNTNVHSTMDYWLEVKQEIEKL